MKKKIKDIKKGDFIRLKESENAPVWIRDEYCRFSKKYAIYKYDDINHIVYIKGDRAVFVDFEF